MASDDDDFAALLAESETGKSRTRRIAVGDVVRGRVIAVGASHAFVAVGGKAEAEIDVNEFRDPATGDVSLREGDELEATVVDDGTRSGSIVLKRVAGRGGHVPGELEQAFANGIPVEGLVAGQNKGGFDVQLGNVRAFCPASQIDRRRGEAAQYVGQRFRFRITKLDPSGRNIVVSRRQLLEEEAAAQAATTMAALREGAIVSGTVTSLRDFGAFVDLGGIEGLIHVSELGHVRVASPADVLQVGQRVEAQVVKIEPGSGGKPGRIGLSLRALAPDPWATVRERFPVGTTVGGIVRRLEQFGAFVEIAPGVDGLVHVSRMVLDRRIAHPRQVVAIDDPVEVTIVEIDAEKRRIGLSMVESARGAKESAELDERRDTEAHLAQPGAAQSLGTLGDLLSRTRPKR
ncbi:MAG TPA: S1 RNA-binding domain-containing protein [Candidatus Binatia bacterium]|nr:S1 RNA-binding domain-containing protein [Candidatus Binatia bacterium]